MEDTSLETTLVDDLATLTKLDEQVLVEQLHLRYDDDRIYTYIGDILVAVNPFRQIEGMYSKETQRRYNKSVKFVDPPHIFAIADNSYQGLINSTKDQCCLVSGESGAGKTESAKFIVRQIIDLCRSGIDIEKKILQVNPLLEAFGNAQTLMNDNSSRFGKYTELVFDGDGKVHGSIISEYLLEKSRVVRQQEGEQNFHIFYYIFAADDLEKYKLTAPEDYPYLGAAQADIDCEAMLKEVKDALRDVGFSQEDHGMIFSILASVLSLSRIDYSSTGDLNPAQIKEQSKRALKVVSELLLVDTMQLNDALTLSVTITRGETIRKPYTLDQAFDTRDALAKALYGRLFGWIVANINSLLAPATMPKGAKTRKIGILDIFGFECFQHNSFEQLCINLANEYLQHFFNRHVFELELEEYAREGIDGKNIHYVDNKPLLDMFLSKPIGLLALLDEESVFPRATDTTLVDKFNANFGTHVNYAAAKNNVDCVFTIKHYAGPVMYTGYGFLEKNRDHLSPDIISLLQSSECRIIAEMFLGKLNETGNLEIGDARGAKKKAANPFASASTQASNPFNPFAKVDDKTMTSNKRPDSVGSQFKTSLNLLIDKMSACTPFFVRCIKPNTDKSPWNFIDDFVMIQLNYTGMLETTRIRREGYSVRPKFSEFVERFRILAFDHKAKVDPTPRSCEFILQRAKIEGWLMGKTKVFLKYYHMEDLEALVILHHKMATVLQKHWRGRKARLAYKVLVAKAREQREKAHDMLHKMASHVKDFASKNKALATIDVERFQDRKAKMEEESRRQNDRKRKQRVEQAEVERKAHLSSHSDLRNELDKMSLDLDRDFADINSKLSAGMDVLNATTDLEVKLKSTDENLKSRADAFAQKLDKTKIEIEQKEAKIQSELEKREVLMQAMEAKLRSGNPQAIALAKEQLQAQESELDDLKFDLLRLNNTKDSYGTILDTLRSQRDRIAQQGVQVNQVRLQQAENSRAQLDKNLKSMETKLEAQQKESDAAAAKLNAAISDKTKQISELQQRVTSQQEQADQIKEEHQRAISQLKTLLTNAEAEVSELRNKLVTQQGLYDNLKKDQENQSKGLRSKLAEADEQLDKVKEERDKLSRQLEGKMKSQELELRNQIEEQDLQIVDLRSQIRKRDAELQSLKLEKESAILQLSTQVAKGEAEAEAQLRVNLHTKQMQLDEREAELTRVNAQFSNVSSLLEMSKAENSTLSNELKRILKEMEEHNESSMGDQRKIKRQLESKLREQQEEFEKKLDDSEQSIFSLKSEMRQKERNWQAQAAEKESLVADMNSKLKAINAELEESRMVYRTKVQELETLRVENQKLAAQLESQESKSSLRVKELEHMVNDLQSLNQQKAAVYEASKAEYDQTLKNREQTIKDLESEMRLKDREIEKSRESAEFTKQKIQSEHEQQIHSLRQDLKAKAIALEDLANSKSELEYSMSELKEMLEDLRTQYDLKIQSHEATKSQLQLAQDELSTMQDEVTRMSEETNAQKQEALRQMEETLATKDRILLEQSLTAIRNLGRKKPGPGVPSASEDAGVDLQRYITTRLALSDAPSEVMLSRFTCKGYLTKQVSSKWTTFFFTLDLHTKTFSWYLDNRELRNSMKGTIALMDIKMINVPQNKEAATTNAFLVNDKSRTHHFRAPSLQSRDIWIRVLDCFATNQMFASKPLTKSGDSASLIPEIIEPESLTPGRSSASRPSSLRTSSPGGTRIRSSSVRTPTRITKKP